MLLRMPKDIGEAPGWMQIWLQAPCPPRYRLIVLETVSGRLRVPTPHRRRLQGTFDVSSMARTVAVRSWPISAEYRMGEMIELTRLNGQKLFVNCDLLKYAEASPDTVLTLVYGRQDGGARAVRRGDGACAELSRADPGDGVAGCGGCAGRADLAVFAEDAAGRHTLTAGPDGSYISWISPALGAYCSRCLGSSGA